MPDFSQLLALLQSKNKRLQWLAIALALAIYSPTYAAIIDDPEMSVSAKVTKALQSTGVFGGAIALTLFDPKGKQDASTDEAEES